MRSASAPFHRAHLRLAACIVALASVTTCRSSPAGSPLPRARHNVIFISIDTLRADALGSYGSSRDASPNLDAFAERSVVFERAIAESSWTLPAHVTMLTGLRTSGHGVRTTGLMPGADLPRLAEIFRAAGYRTFAMTGGGFVSEEVFGRGFDSFDVKFERKTPGRGLRGNDFRNVVGVAIQHISEIPRSDRFFAFLHTYNVHCPFSPPAPFLGSLAPLDPALAGLEDRCNRKHWRDRPPSRTEIEYLRDRYDEGVKWVDEALGMLFDHLDSSGLLENTIVVVTSDHGEGFLEHDKVGHGATLYNELLWVPLIVRVPGLEPRRISTPVGHVDLAPTLLDLTEQPIPDLMQGASLGLLLTGIEEPERAAFSENTSINLDRGRAWRRRSIVDGDHHLIVKTPDPPTEPLRTTIELFHTATDPEERHHLEDAPRNLVRRLLAKLEAATQELETNPEERPDLTEQERRNLEALGYL